MRSYFFLSTSVAAMSAKIACNTHIFSGFFYSFFFSVSAMTVHIHFPCHTMLIRQLKLIAMWNCIIVIDSVSHVCFTQHWTIFHFQNDIRGPFMILCFLFSLSLSIMVKNFECDSGDSIMPNFFSNWMHRK